MNNAFIVTGGAGFIGSNMLSTLNQLGHDDITRLRQAGYQEPLTSIEARVRSYVQDYLLHQGGRQ